MILDDCETCGRPGAHLWYYDGLWLTVCSEECARELWAADRIAVYRDHCDRERDQ